MYAKAISEAVHCGNGFVIPSALPSKFCGMRVYIVDCKISQIHEMLETRRKQCSKSAEYFELFHKIGSL